MSKELVDYAIIPITEHEFDEALNVAQKIREKNLTSTTVLTDKKLGDKLGYAAKIAKHGIVIGESEIGAKTLKAKNFTTGEENTINIEVISNPEDFWANN